MSQPPNRINPGLPVRAQRSMAFTAPKPPSGGGGKTIGIIVLLTAIVCGLLFAQSSGLLDFGRKGPVAVSTPRPANTPQPPTPPPAPTIPAPAPVVESVKTAEPEKPAPPTGEQLVQSQIEAVRAVGTVRLQMTRGDFAGAARGLDEWLAGNGTHLQAAEVQAQAERLRAAAGVMPGILANPTAFVGATIRIGDSAGTVMSVAEGRLKCQVKSQFGVIEKPVALAALPETALESLLKQADAGGKTTLAATYLLGFGRSAEARASMPANAQGREALLAGIAEWEGLARDYAVIVALDGVGTLVNRGEFAAAGQRLEQSRKLYGGHVFLTTAYAAKIEDWTKQIVSAPSPTTAPSSVAASTSALSLGTKAPALLPPGPVLPAGAIDAARAALLDGVSTAPRPGQQGPVATYGAAAFPVLGVKDEKGIDVVATAGISGKGRALIFGHTGYISSASQTEDDLGKLMLNGVKWCSGKAKPRIGIRGCDLDKFLDSKGFRAQKISQPLKKSVLINFDVVIMNMADLNGDEEAEALKEYIEGGGGVIGAMTGWAYSQGKSRSLYADNRANSALAGVGIAFTDRSVFRSGTLVAIREPAPMLNAYSAVGALQKRLGAAPPPSLAEMTARATPAPVAQESGAGDYDLGAQTLGLALEAMPPASKAPFLQVLSGLASSGKPIVPTKEAPLTEGMDNDKRLRAGLEARVLKMLPAEAIAAHPAAKAFPGRVPAEARPIVKTVRVNPAIPDWQSTGLYADAGAKITVKLPPEAVAAGYQVRIGCHTDGLYNLEKWPRLPEITRQFPLNSTETAASCAFGGLVYVVVPGSAKSQPPFEAAISGAFEAPYFVLGETTDDQWKEMGKRPAPWAELACKNMIITLPAEIAHTIKNPTEVMQYWQRAVDAQDELSDVAADRRRPERMVPDLAISAGFMHSGYPIMFHVPEAREMVTVSKIKTPGWGFQHEIGHNHQKGDWTFEGTGEVTNNIFAVYVTEMIDGVKRGENHGAIKADTQAKKWGRYRTMGTPYTEWKSDPFLALGTFLKLIDAFGWDPMKKFYRSFNDSNFGPKPATDEDKRNQWMVRYSKIVGKNLGPYFDACGIPVSSSAKAEISSLPEWMPPGMK